MKNGFLALLALLTSHSLCFAQGQENLVADIVACYGNAPISVIDEDNQMQVLDRKIVAFRAGSKLHNPLTQGTGLDKIEAGKVILLTSNLGNLRSVRLEHEVPVFGALFNAQDLHQNSVLTIYWDLFGTSAKAISEEISYVGASAATTLECTRDMEKAIALLEDIDTIH